MSQSPNISTLPLPPAIMERLKLNLGCSDRLMKGYTNVDLCEPADQIADLTKAWPWMDSSVESIMAWHIFEHLPSKLHTMNEAWRVLAPGCNIDIVVPTTEGRGAFQDPTHKSFWTPNDVFYFCEEFAEWHRFRKSYGILAHFKGVQRAITKCPNEVVEVRFVLQAVKP